MAVNADDMRDYIRTNVETLNKEIDDWLTCDVFTSIINDKAVVDIPVEFLDIDLIDILRERGFNVEVVDDPNLQLPKIIIGI